MKTTKTINIHRYCNKVALSFDGQPTVYVGQELACQLITAISEAVIDIELREFTKSRFETRELVEQGAALTKGETLKAKLHQHVTGSGNEDVVNIQAPFTTDNQKHQAYLDWLNNFGTAEKFAAHYNITIKAARDVINEGRRIHNASLGKPLPWHVVTVSTNTGSFGHKSVLVIREDGEGRELLLQAYGGEKLPVRGDVLEVLPTSEVPPRALPTTTAKIAKQIISTLK